MIAKKALYSVLIVTGSERGGASLKDMLDPLVYSPVTLVSNAGEARRLLISDTFDLVIVNAPLPDEPGYEFALSAVESPDTFIILMVKNEIFDEVSYRVEDYGVITISKPVSKPLFNQILKIAAAAREKYRKLEKENARLSAKLDEMKLTERAKWTLIEHEKLSEPEAHRYIEKKAMDMRSTKKAVAEAIIKSYGNQ